MKNLLNNANFRKAMYGVFAAVLALFIALGWITVEQENLISQLVKSVVDLLLISGFVIARQNVPTASSDTDDVEEVVG